MVDLHANHTGILAALQEIPGVALRIESALIPGGGRILPDPDLHRVFQRFTVVHDFLDSSKLFIQRVTKAVSGLNQVVFNAQLGGVLAVLLIAFHRGSAAALGRPDGPAGLNIALIRKKAGVLGIGNIGHHIAVDKLRQIVRNDGHTPGRVGLRCKGFSAFVPVLRVKNAVLLRPQAHAGPVIEVCLRDADVSGAAFQLERG